MRHGIPISIDKQDAILALYDKNPATSIKKIAETVGCAQQTANDYLRKSGRETSNKRFRKNLRYIDSDGYIVLYVPEHFAAKANGQIREHVMVAANALGRKLKSNECVHHINGNKTDNRNTNLLVCDKGYHIWLHWKMAELYQKEHFA